MILRWEKWWSCIVLALVLAGCDSRPPQARKAPAGVPVAVQQAWERIAGHTFQDLQGQPRQLSQLRKGVLVVNYWASWCPPCRMELPGFAHLAEKYAEKGVQFVGVGIDSPENVQRFAAEQKLPFPLWQAMTADLAATAELGNTGQGLPFTVVIDANGALRKAKVGFWREDDLDVVLKSLVN